MQRLIRFKSCKAALIGLLLALPLFSLAQERPNRFSLMTGFSNALNDPFCIRGGEYQRQLHKQWSVGVQYSMWRQNLPGGRLRKGLLYERIYPKMNQSQYWDTGFVMSVYHYKFIDLYSYYSIFLLDKTIKFTIGLGPSMAFGKNMVINYLWINPEPPQDSEVNTEEVNASYFGLSQKSELTYSFLKDRVDAGLLLSGKYYFGLGPQIDLGFVLGVNF